MLIMHAVFLAFGNYLTNSLINRIKLIKLLTYVKSAGKKKIKRVKSIISAGCLCTTNLMLVPEENTCYLMLRFYIGFIPIITATMMLTALKRPSSRFSAILSFPFSSTCPILHKLQLNS